MDFSMIGFVATAFVGMTLINRVLEGSLIASADISILNTMTIMRTVNVGFFSVPIPNLSFFTGIGHLVKWDYSFFGGNAQIFQFFLYAITFAVSFILFLAVIGLLYNAFNRVR